MRHALVTAVREGLRAAADPGRAPQMQRYMRSELPFRGVPMTRSRPICRAAMKAHPLADRDEWEAVIRELYDAAGYREERYAALAVLSAPPYARWLDGAAIPLLEHVITRGAWWDLVDDASVAAGVALAQHPDVVRPRLLKWAEGSDLWLRRAAVIAQRKARAATDTGLLSEAIEASIDHPDFFVRKGIGWALREYSKTDATWVRAFVSAHPGLSPLSRREALRWVDGR